MGGGVDEILGPSRERRITRARAEFYRRARREAGQPSADLWRMTGHTQPGRKPFNRATFPRSPREGCCVIGPCALERPNHVKSESSSREVSLSARKRGMQKHELGE